MIPHDRTTHNSQGKPFAKPADKKRSRTMRWTYESNKDYRESLAARNDAIKRLEFEQRNRATPDKPSS